MIRVLSFILLTLTAAAQPFSQSDPVFSQTCSSLLPNLVGCWRLEEASGTRYDSSSKGIQLTSSNSVGSTVGIVGNCGTFVAASSQFLSVTNATLQMSNDFTVALWCYLASTSSSAMYPITKWDTGAGGGEWALDYTKTTNTFNLTLRNSGNSSNGIVGGVSPVSLNTWYLVVFGNDSANSRAFLSIDSGTLRTTTWTGGVRSSTVPVCIGRITSQTGTFWDGRIDEVQIWKNKVLSASEIAALYNQTKGTHFPWAHP